jgi:hypothetical protein
VVLVLAGLSPVVSYHTNNSSAKDSPLFQVRTQHAIAQESNALTCEYIGKGKLMLFPLRNSIDDRITNTIDIICKMDDVFFNNYVAQVVHYLQSENKLTDREISEVIQILHYIRVNSVEIKDVVTKEIIGDNTNEYITCKWFPGCIFITVITWIPYILIGIFTHLLSCYYPTNCC